MDLKLGKREHVVKIDTVCAGLERTIEGINFHGGGVFRYNLKVKKPGSQWVFPTLKYASLLVAWEVLDIYDILSGDRAFHGCV